MHTPAPVDVGSFVPCLFGAMAMEAVGRAAIFKEMIVPSPLPILIPVIVGFGMNLLLGPGAGIRALFPSLPVEGRNRTELLKRAGKVQLPYLVGPKTGTEMFESAAIRGYPLATHAR